MDLLVEGNENYTPPFTTLRTSAQLKEWLTLINTFARFNINEDMKHRLAALWCLLMDPNHATALALAARSVYNYHCGDLIETFRNLISLQWSSPSALSPGGNIDQLAVDILRRILTADVE